MDDLTNRQTDILRALIEEYTDTGEPIGSSMLEKKYKLGVSPATIRNEMVELARKGYLKKEYFSAGRVPSAKGFRFYIKHLMKEKGLSTGDEVAYKNGIWDERDDVQRLLSHATKILASKTSLLSIALTDQGDLYYSGVGNLMSIHEFDNIELTKALFTLLDESRFWAKILEKMRSVEDDLYFMLGEEDFSNIIYEPCASIFAEFEGQNMHGFIGIVGPKRMGYDSLTPQVKYFSELIESIIRQQGK
jgi:heat-inducible transcriptional repressor